MLRFEKQRNEPMMLKGIQFRLGANPSAGNCELFLIQSERTNRRIFWDSSVVPINRGYLPHHSENLQIVAQTPAESATTKSATAEPMYFRLIVVLQGTEADMVVEGARLSDVRGFLLEAPQRLFQAVDRAPPSRALATHLQQCLDRRHGFQ